MSVTRSDIVAAIRALGVSPSEMMIAHSSFKSFGGVDGGPLAVAQALVDVVSPGGTAFVPTFNYGRDVFDPATAPSYDGVVTEFFRKLPGAIRSLHPTHPIAGVGPAAAEILAGHERTHPFAECSPLWRLWERNGWVLLMGVDHRANSVIHVAEEHLAMPYLDVWRRARVLQGGEVVEVRARRPSCSEAFNVVDAPLRAKRQIREAVLGSSRLMLMKSTDVVAAAEELLSCDPSALLCERADCDYCVRARGIVAH